MVGNGGGVVLAEPAGATRRVPPHVFGTTFAANCMRAGVSTASFEKLLGHDRRGLTEIYLDIGSAAALLVIAASIAV